MRDYRFGSFVVTALVVATMSVACSSSSDDASASSDAPISGDASWSEAKSTLGVTNWAEAPSENSADQSAQLTGYDDAHEVKSQFVVDRTEDAAGNTNVRIRSMVQGPAVLEFRALPDRNIVIVQDTFRDHPDALRAWQLAAANLKTQQVAGADGSLINKSSLGLHVLDNAPLIGNQEQLICKDAKGKACEKPPGAVETVRDCVIGALGLGGAGCLTTGGETVGVGCVVSAMVALAGGLVCADDVSKRDSCKCVTPCAAQCQQKFNRQYACPPNNSASCTNAGAIDRMEEASCVKGCDAK